MRSYLLFAALLCGFLAIAQGTPVARSQKDEKVTRIFAKKSTKEADSSKATNKRSYYTNLQCSCYQNDYSSDPTMGSVNLDCSCYDDGYSNYDPYYYDTMDPCDPMSMYYDPYYCDPSYYDNSYYDCDPMSANYDPYYCDPSYYDPSYYDPYSYDSTYYDPYYDPYYYDNSYYDPSYYDPYYYDTSYSGSGYYDPYYGYMKRNNGDKKEDGSSSMERKEEMDKKNRRPKRETKRKAGPLTEREFLQRRAAFARRNLRRGQRINRRGQVQGGNRMRQRVQNPAQRRTFANRRQQKQTAEKEPTSKANNLNTLLRELGELNKAKK